MRLFPLQIEIMTSNSTCRSSSADTNQRSIYFTPAEHTQGQNNPGRTTSGSSFPFPSGFDIERSKKRRLSDTTSSFSERKRTPSIPAGSRSSATSSTNTNSCKSDASEKRKEEDSDLCEQDIVSHRNGLLFDDDEENGGTVKVGFKPIQIINLQL